MGEGRGEGPVSLILMANWNKLRGRFFGLDITSPAPQRPAKLASMKLTPTDRQGMSFGTALRTLRTSTDSNDLCNSHFGPGHIRSKYVVPALAGLHLATD